MALLEEPIIDIKTIKNYIGGEWVGSRGEIEDVVNPANCRTIAKVPISTEAEMGAAVAAAAAAFPDWRRTTPLARARLLFRLKELLEENFEELSRIQTQEHGKTIDESRGETRRGIENVEVACGIPTLMQGYYSEDIATGIDEWVIPTPLGVFGIIGPFNFPFMIPLWSAPYAVATGNCVVIKPSQRGPDQPDAPGRAGRGGRFSARGLERRQRRKNAAVSGMLEHPDIKGMTFVGSTPRRPGTSSTSGAARPARGYIAQAGAKNFMAIMPDCDVDRTIAAMMTSFFGNTGQRCLSAANAVIVGEDDLFYRGFVAKVVDQASKIRIGYGLDESVQMGPVRDREKKDNIIRYIETGLKEGAKLTLDGRKVKVAGGCPDTCFLGPTIFEDVTPDMRIGRRGDLRPGDVHHQGQRPDEAIDHATPTATATATPSSPPTVKAPGSSSTM